MRIKNFALVPYARRQEAIDATMIDGISCCAWHLLLIDGNGEPQWCYANWFGWQHQIVNFDDIVESLGGKMYHTLDEAVEDKGCVAKNNPNRFSVPGGSEYHLPNCSRLIGVRVRYPSVEAAEAAGLTPCSTCCGGL